MDDSITFARWRHWALPYGHIGATWWIQLNLCFLWPITVHNPNSKSIGSAVSAQLTLESSILYNGQPFLQNCPLSKTVLSHGEISASSMQEKLPCFSAWAMKLCYDDMLYMQQQTCYEQQQGRPALILTSSQLNIICCLPALIGSILTVHTCIDWVYTDSAYLHWLGLYWVFTCNDWVYTNSAYLHWVGLYWQCSPALSGYVLTVLICIEWVYIDSAHLHWLGLYWHCSPALSGSSIHSSEYW